MTDFHDEYFTYYMWSRIDRRTNEESDNPKDIGDRGSYTDMKNCAIALNMNNKEEKTDEEIEQEMKACMYEKGWEVSGLQILF